MSSSIASVTFSPPVAAPGTTVTMTVQGTWEQADQVTVTTPDGATGSGTLDVLEPLTVNDPTGRTWTPVSNNGIQAVFSGIA